MPIYNTPSSACQMTPPIARRCQPNAKCATPAKTRSHATTMFTATPAAMGRPIAKTPARIMRRLTAIDQPVKCLASAAIVEVAMGSSTEEMLGFGEPTPVDEECQSSADGRWHWLLSIVIEHMEDSE